jgi:cytochrome c-type biogenesis protein CcmE
MEEAVEARPGLANRAKFIVGGVLIIAAVIYLVISSTSASAQYFFTVEELKQRGETVIGKNIRISGAVIGDSIQYDSQSLTLKFSVANIPGDNNVIDARGGLAAVLKSAEEDKSLARMNVVYKGVKPDLLKNEAQAIMTGKLEADGSFSASELLLKCPTKYEEAIPQQAQ